MPINRGRCLPASSLRTPHATLAASSRFSLPTICSRAASSHSSAMARAPKPDRCLRYRCRRGLPLQIMQRALRHRQTSEVRASGAIVSRCSVCEGPQFQCAVKNRRQYCWEGWRRYDEYVGQAKNRIGKGRCGALRFAPPGDAKRTRAEHPAEQAPYSVFANSIAGAPNPLSRRPEAASPCPAAWHRSRASDRAASGHRRTTVCRHR